MTNINSKRGGIAGH